MLALIAEQIGAPEPNRFWHNFDPEDSSKLISSKFKNPFEPTTILEQLKQEDVPKTLLEWVTASEKRRRDAHNAAQESRLNHKKCKDAYEKSRLKASQADEITESMRNQIAEQSIEIKMLKAEKIEVPDLQLERTTSRSQNSESGLTKIVRRQNGLPQDPNTTSE